MTLKDLRCAADVDKWTLYSARHGEIMHLLMSGVAVEIVADSCRIPVSTLLRHYRRHNLADDTLERNGAFAEVHSKVVLARAREEGFLTTATSIEGLVRRVQQVEGGEGRSMAELVLLPRPRLWSVLAPVVAADVSTSAAAAALLRSAAVSEGLRRNLARAESDEEPSISEDDVLSQADMVAFVARAQAAEQQRRVERAMSLADLWGVERPLVLGASQSSAQSLLLTNAAQQADAAAAAATLTGGGSASGRISDGGEDDEVSDEEDGADELELPIALRGLRQRERLLEVGQPAAALSARAERASRAEGGLFGYEGGGERDEEAVAGPGVHALFARAELGTVVLPPLGLALGGDAADEASARVLSRIEAQEQVTGRSITAQRAYARIVVKFDYYFQALSSGYAGALRDDHLLVLRRKWSLIGHSFKDMVRVHGEGANARLAFVRGGVQQMLFAMLTAGDVRAVLAAVDVATLGGAAWQLAARLAVLAGDDARLLAGSQVLRPRFEVLVRSLHAEGGMFASGLSEEILARGCSQLHVTTCFVRETVRVFALTKVGIRRMEKAPSDDAVVGWRNDGRSGTEPSGVGLMRRVRPYSAETISRFRCASWGRHWSMHMELM